MNGNITFQIKFEMDPSGKIVDISKVSGGDSGPPPKVPEPPHSDVVVMVATKHSPGNICFLYQGQWVCF